MRHLPLPIELLSTYLAVSEQSPTGLTWIKSPGNRIRPGRPAGRLNGIGYYTVSLQNRTYKNHRVVWALVHGRDPGPLQIDHIDRCRSNNVVTNLRLATVHVNNHNMSSNSVLGVGVFRDRGRFRARLQVRGEVINLGCFGSPEAAASAYKEAFRQLVPPLPEAAL